MHQAAALPSALRLSCRMTEEMVEHDAPHPSTIDPDPDEEWPDE